MPKIQIKCSYPDKHLSSNKRLHWSVKSKYTAQCRMQWFYELSRYKNALKNNVDFVVSFAPPDLRRRDVQNAVIASKALIDALSDVVGIDDSKFKILWPREFLPPVDGGAVFIEFQSLEVGAWQDVK